MSAGHNPLVTPGGISWKWWAVAGLALTAFVLGTYGSMLEFEQTHRGHFLDALYHSLQLFALHPPHLEHPNVPFELARWLAVIVVGLATAGAVRHAFREQFRKTRASLLKGHVVVCGPGPIALDVVRAQRVSAPRKKSSRSSPPLTRRIIAKRFTRQEPWP